MNDLLENFVRTEIMKMSLKEHMTKFLVAKKKRGTYQSLEESRKLENEITEATVEYIKQWLVDELVDGKLKKVLLEEINNQILMELSRKGFNGLFKL
jgi:glutathionyl-hydroquinone reductase